MTTDTAPAPITRDGSPLIARTASFAPATWNPEARTIDVVWTTGADVTRMDYWTGRQWIERLDVTPGAVDLARLNSGGPVLNTHSSYDLADVIGVVVDGSARIAKGQGTATIRFSERAEVAGIVADVAAGIIRNISVGYVVTAWQVTEATRTSAELRTATAWTPYELSLVPIPADAGAQTRAHAPAGDVPATPTAARAAFQEPQMTEQVSPQAAPDAAAIIAAERARASDILLIARQAGQPDTWAQDHIASGAAADTVRAEALAAVAARATPRVPAQNVQITQDEGDTQRRLLANALEHRGNIPGVALEEGARQYRGFRLLDFARQAIELAGENARGLSQYETFQRAMQLGRSRGMMSVRSPGHVSGDFPDLLANTASKSLRASYTAAPRTFLPWTTQMNLPDFKSFKAVALSGASQLATIEEDAEITYGTIGDDAETWALLRYGKGLRISYVAMINDDMSGFTRVPAMMGAAAARKESDVVYGVLTTNAAMADGTALFAAGHSNTTTGALSADAAGVLALGTAQAKLRLQTAPNGELLNLAGRHLVIPATMETKVLQLFGRTLVPSTAGSVNPLQFNIIAEGRLDATSTAAYYLMADPSQIDTVAYGYLDGAEGPQISTDLDFDTDGMATKVMHNFGAKALDWRGMVYSTGA